MTVFKGYMKIIKRNAAIILMYMGIFFAVTMAMQSAVKGTEAESYQAQSVKIAFVDEDGGPLAKGLEGYLEKHHQIIPMDNNKEKLQEELFYQNIEYIVKIPEGFEEKSLAGNQKLSVTKIPGSYTSFYVDQQINSFLNSAKTYYAAGYTAQEAAKAVNGRKEPAVAMLDVNGNAGGITGYNYYFRYLPYLMLCVLCYVLGNILSSFHKPDIRRRMQASAVTAHRQNLEALLAAGVFALALWGISIAGGLILYGKAFAGSPGMPYYLLNSLTILLVALALSYLVGLITDNVNALNGIVNTVSLGMCFLCGVFVPLDIMGKGVKTFAQFLPVYWYEKANGLLGEFGAVTGSVRMEILQAVGIQVIFAAAILCVAMVVGKRRGAGA